MLSSSLSRRRFLTLSAATGAAAMIGMRWSLLPAEAAEKFEVVHTEAEWRKILSPARYAVLREQHTERPWSSSLEKEKRNGTFVCAGCQLPLFSSRTKFESGTGWPSFWAPLRHAVATRADHELILPRIEVHCRRCGGHLGHVFDDGPKPTGKRYCMNGLALDFRPA